MQIRALSLAAIIHVLVGGCASWSAPPDTGPVIASPQRDSAPNERSSTAPLHAALPPLEAPSPWLDLPVPGHRAAVVSLPVGATTARPVIVATHGAGGRPEWQCRAWRQLVGDRAFVLCPRGYPLDPRFPDTTGYFYTDHYALGREISLALSALAARFPIHSDMTAPVYAGFSQGATMGALLLPNHPARFARAILIEGGYGGSQEWNLAAARSFKASGGERVLFACGRADCSAQAGLSAGYMRREGVAAHVVYAPGAGHTYGGLVWEGVARALPWLISGDPRL